MASLLQVHPTTPQARILRRAADCLQDGGVIVYPPSEKLVILAAKRLRKTGR